jgi:hypothetical protein
MLNDKPVEIPSTFFFPLRTNVRYFDTPEIYLSLEERLKQALILYDRVVFQDGVYQIWISERGTFEVIRPRASSDQQVKFAGEQSRGVFHLQSKPSDAGPDVPFTTIMAAQTKRYFTADFGLLYEQARSKGIEGIELMPFELKPEFKDLASKLAEQDRDLQITTIQSETESTDAPFFKKAILKNLNMDLILISDLGWPSSLDPIHAPLVCMKARYSGSLSPAPGFAALEFAVPYAGEAPWEELAEIRHIPSLVQFRKKLLEAENKARAMLGKHGEDDIRYEVGQIIKDELLKEISSLIPSSGDHIRNVALELAGAIIPPPLGTAPAVIDVAKEIKDWLDMRHSWLTVFLRLQEYNK